MDTLASLALATEPPSEKLLDRLPHNRKDYILSKKMFKHILGQSIYQMIVISLIVFTGEFWIPEVEDKFDEENPEELCKKYRCDDGIDDPNYQQHYDMVISGRLYFIGSGRFYYDILVDDRYPSRHFTFVFNTFVMLQIFNFFNARKIFDEFNIFQGLTGNMMFPMIVGLIIALQIVIISFGGNAFNCYKFGKSGQYVGGLSIIQWLICIGFGFGSNLMTFILKPLPEEILCSCQLGKNAANPLTSNAVMQMKRSYSQASLQRKFTIGASTPSNQPKHYEQLEEDTN